MNSRTKILESVSPDGVWKLIIWGSNKESEAWYADFRSFKLGKGMSVPFGFDADIEQVTINWNLPDNVLGVFLSGECYLLFRWGVRRRRRREKSRVGEARHFSAEEIAWVCAKKHTQKHT